MILKFLRKNSNRRLILIFTGWGTGPELYTGVDIPGWDVAVAFRIDGKPLDISKLDGYYTIYLFAWSLGVYMADLKLPSERITKAFAINGTVTPVHDDYGIPVAIFHGTADNLDPRNLTKFRRRTMPDSETFKRLFPEEGSPLMCRCLASQLYEVMDMLDGSEVKPRLQWTRAYIGTRDRIFPPDNMRKAWGIDPEVEIVESDDAHFMDIPAIIRSVIADTGKVSARFSKASSTYDSHAIPQKMTAVHLASMLHRFANPTDVHNVLEIGPGTGFLTRYWTRFLTPDHIDFVDITKAGPFDTPGHADYHVADAETWISDRIGDNDRYDLIVSSSVIQWFADIPRFLDNCAAIMNPGGLLAISTFAPGNLTELDALRPAPLLYPTLTELCESVAGNFDVLTSDSFTICMEFENRRHLMMHLKHTGVAGSTSSSRSVPLTDISTLTYRPVFILARRK